MRGWHFFCNGWHFFATGVIFFATGVIFFAQVPFFLHTSVLLGDKNKAVVNLINQEHLPFAFNLNKESILENPDYGDLLVVTPFSGTVSSQSQILLEMLFKPKYEMSYNYNVIWNIKRKARPWCWILKVLAIQCIIQYLLTSREFQFHMMYLTVLTSETSFLMKRKLNQL